MLTKEFLRTSGGMLNPYTDHSAFANSALEILGCAKISTEYNYFVYFIATIFISHHTFFSMQNKSSNAPRNKIAMGYCISKFRVGITYGNYTPI